MDQYQATYILTLEILRTQGMAGSLTMKIEQNWWLKIYVAAMGSIPDIITLTVAAGYMYLHSW